MKIGSRSNFVAIVQLLCGVGNWTQKFKINILTRDIKFPKDNIYCIATWNII